MTDRKPRVLFLCTGNSARSQMAEAFMRHYGGDRFEAHSAGMEPKGINPYTVRVMAEKEFDLDGQRSKGIEEYMTKVHIGYLITVCSNAEENCPIMPFVGARIYWPFEDPAAFEGTDEEKTKKFREVRDQIEARVKEWLAEG